MYISSASSQNSIFGLTNQTNTSRKPLLRLVEPVVVSTAVSTTEQKQSLNKQTKHSTIIDKKKY